MDNKLNKFSENGYKVLTYILKNPGCYPADMFFDFPTIDGIVEILSGFEYITNKEGALNITELGRNALVEYEVLKKMEKKEKRFKNIQFIISIIFSLAALAVSIISLILQFQE